MSPDEPKQDEPEQPAGGIWSNPQPNLPPAGWFPDPEQPGSKRRRYWDGAEWTDQYEGADEAALDHPLSRVSIGVIIVASIGNALVRREPFTPTSEFLGYILGALIIALILPFVVRLIYVGVFARGKPLLTPWVLAVSAGIALLAFLGAVGQEAQNQ